jgi:putative transposase
MLKIVEDSAAPNPAGGSLLDEIVRDGARQMLAAALLAEVAAYIEGHRGEVDGDGRRLVVRNGFHEPREVTTAAGAVQVRQPRVNDKRVEEVTGVRKRFSSAILPAWSRKLPRVAEVLPLLYLHGLASSDFGSALEQFLGSDQGLSAATITRLTAQWQDEVRAFNTRSLAGSDYVYCWVDGIHLKVRLEQDKVYLLVIIGVRADGRKELVALADGFRESSESWADLLRDCSAAEWPLRCSPSVMGRSASGRPSATCFPPPRGSAVGGTSRATLWPRCRSRRSRPRGPRWRRSTTPRTRPTPGPPRRRSRPSSG